MFGDLLQKYGPNAEETLSFVLLSSPVYTCMIAIEMIGLYDALSRHLVQFIHSIGQQNSLQVAPLRQQIIPSALETTISIHRIMFCMFYIC